MRKNIITLGAGLAILAGAFAGQFMSDVPAPKPQMAMQAVTPEVEINNLLREEAELNSRCRDAAPFDDACRKRDAVVERLRGLGMCYGEDAEYAYQAKWAPCRPQPY